MTLLKDNNYKEINVALLSLEADIKNKITGSFDTSVIGKQLAEINSRIDKINAGGGSSSSDEIEDINSKLNSNSIKIRNIEQNVENIDTQINGIEQKLSDIFSAESKVTDFNTTTGSGVYYWVNDAANRPTDYGVLLVNKYDGGSSTSIWINQVAYGTDNKIYFRQNINSTGWSGWQQLVTMDKLKPEVGFITGSLLSPVITGSNLYYQKFGDGRLFINGWVKLGNVSVRTKLFTLPNNWKASSNYLLPCYVDQRNIACACMVNITEGDVFAYTPIPATNELRFCGTIYLM